MPKAYLAIRHEIPARRDSIASGLRCIGYTVIDSMRENREVVKIPSKALANNDLLLIWNRGGRFERLAIDFETAGGSVIVFENGYFAARGEKTYAMALHDHNGNGWSPSGAGHTMSRWNKLYLAVAPWQKHGKHILLCKQRGIGSQAMAQPHNWGDTMARRLQKLTDRPIVIREHPAFAERRGLPARTIEDDLRDAHCLITFSSGAANEAIVAGVPVFYGAPHLIMETAAKQGFDKLEEPYLDSRDDAFAKLAWAQWTLSELSTGDPFQYLIRKL